MVWIQSQGFTEERDWIGDKSIDVVRYLKLYNMEAGMICKNNSVNKQFENITKSKQILEGFLEKSQKRMNNLKKSLAKEKQKNSLLISKIEILAELEAENKDLQEELLSKSKQIRKLSQQLKILYDRDDDSNSETWKHLYEASKYSKTSTTDYLETSHSLREFIEKISDSSHLRNFLHKRRSLMQEIKSLSTTLSYEKLLHHICCLSSEIVSYFEDIIISYSTMDSEALSTPNYKPNY